MARLLELPNEILFDIIAFSRMEDFENIMLACRRFYSIGTSLIADYARHKRWLQPHDWNRPGQPLVNPGPSPVLGKLRQQHDLNKYMALSAVEELHIVGIDLHGCWMMGPALSCQGIAAHLSANPRRVRRDNTFRTKC